MEYAFWDSSAVVRLCVARQLTPAVLRLGATYRIAVWWSTRIEVRSAFARLLRMGQLTFLEQAAAQVELDYLRRTWREMLPDEPIRQEAESLVDRFPLKAADAQQLAAALSWCAQEPAGQAFISGDVQLVGAAHQLGFQTIQV
jgi:predicted nucleic acid-binding protein